MNFILFDTIRASLKDAPCLSRQDFSKKIREILGSNLEKVIDNHNTTSILFVYGSDDKKYVLKAEYGKDTATHNEILWYKTLKKDNSAIRALFLNSYQEELFALLLLEYVEEAQTIDELSFGLDPLSIDITGYIEAILDYDRQLFLSTAHKANHEMVNQFYLGKYQKRRKESLSFKYLDELLAVPTIQINGKSYVTADRIIQKLENSVTRMRYLTPNRLGLIHGDLHFGNVLIDKSSVYLIDPNGNLKMPIEYDIGKLMHSIHGNYGAIMRGLYELSISINGEFTFKVNGPKQYLLGYEALRTQLNDREFLQGLYSEALHFATMLPHHATNRRETTALYLRCIELFDELDKALS